MLFTGICEGFVTTREYKNLVVVNEGRRQTNVARAAGEMNRGQLAYQIAKGSNYDEQSDQVQGLLLL
jgi:hypothetical protein